MGREDERRVRICLLSWAYWTGRGEVVRDVREKGAGFLDGKPASVRGLFSGIARSLYSPPSEDHPPSGGIWGSPAVDGAYRMVSRELGIPPAAFWPRSHGTAFILSHDIDRIRMTYQEILAAVKRGRLRGAAVEILRLFERLILGRGADPYANLGEILEKEREWGVNAAFFVLREKRRLGCLLKLQPQHFIGVYDPAEISDELGALYRHGHELGVHLSLDANACGKSLERERRYLGKHLPGKLSGARSHYLRFTEKTAELLLEQGFDYDSSMGFNHCCGFRCGTAFPFVLHEKDDRLLWELPLHAMDTALFRRGFGADGVREAREVLFPLISLVRKGGGMMMANFHQRYFNGEFRSEVMGLLESVILQQKANNAWITTPEKLLRWWFEERPNG